MPSTPPRRGKRLDTHWGEFGILAARYFAPLQFGTPVPNTLRDAWGRIDSAILYSVYGKPVEALSPEEIKLYQLVGAELEYSCASTLSDWHKKGLQRFTEFILNHEHFLSRNSIQSQPAAVSNRPVAVGTRSHLRVKRWAGLTIILLLVLALGLGSLKISRIYSKGMQVYQDVNQVQALGSPPFKVETIENGCPGLEEVTGRYCLLERRVQSLASAGAKIGVASRVWE